jgi:hypothetical protein
MATMGRGRKRLRRIQRLNNQLKGITMEIDLSGINEIASAAWSILKVALLVPVFVLSAVVIDAIARYLTLKIIGLDK